MAKKASNLLPDTATIRVLQHPGRISTATLGKTEHLLVIFPAKPAATAWRQCPDGGRLRALRERRKSGEVITARLHTPANTGVTAGFLPASGNGKQLPDRFSVLSFAGKLAAAVRQDNPASIAVLAAGFPAELVDGLLKDLLLALRAHFFALPAFTSKRTPAARLRSIKLCGAGQRMAVDRQTAEADALNLARWLTALPPNKLDAKAYRRAIETLAKTHGWESNFLDEARLKRLGAGAFLAVAQGNAAAGAGIMQLRYRPAGVPKKRPPLISLAGKGIIFDTGGTNLKPFKAMLDMHCDMAGSAVALATLSALTALEYPQPVDCWLAITENRLSNDAYKSRDIVTASNGTTIEVIHTDAEGRMALADTLALAGRDKPKAMVDFATLTGSCVAALTDRYSGAFCNREDLLQTLIDAGRQCGERIWPFPLDDDFDADIRSKAADVLQCAAGGGGDHIQAARFLQRFVPESTTWVHVDLSAATRKGGLAQVPTEITGFGVRYALQLIIDHETTLTGG